MLYRGEAAILIELRKGFLYLIISYVISFVAIMMIVEEAFTSIFTSIPSSAPSVRATSVISILLMIIALAISIYAIRAKIRPGFGYLSQVDRLFKISYTGTTLLIVGIVVMVVGIIALIATSPVSLYNYLLNNGTATPFAMLILEDVGAIIAVMGQIPTFIIGAFRLYGRYIESLYLLAGILYIIAILYVIGFYIAGFFGGAGVAMGSALNLVATIAMYKALKKTTIKLAIL